MIRKLVIMAKSKKGEYGYCVAGLDLQSGEWIRLNLRGEYSIPRHLFCCENKEIDVLDTIAIDLIDDDNRFFYQPENRYCDINSLQILKEEPKKVVERRLVQDSKLRDYIFFDDNNLLYYEWLKEYQGDYYSLMVIKPENVVFHRNNSGKLVVDFEYNEKQYRDFRITDEEFSKDGIFEERMPSDIPFLFVVSLGEKFDNKNSGESENWKLVASVIDAVMFNYYVV